MTKLKKLYEKVMKENKPKFKVGDKVSVIGDSHKGTIKSVHDGRFGFIYKVLLPIRGVMELDEDKLSK